MFVHLFWQCIQLNQPTPWNITKFIKSNFNTDVCTVDWVYNSVICISCCTPKTTSLISSNQLLILMFVLLFSLQNHTLLKDNIYIYIYILSISNIHYYIYAYIVHVYVCNIHIRILFEDLYLQQASFALKFDNNVKGRSIMLGNSVCSFNINHHWTNYCNSHENLWVNEFVHQLFLLFSECAENDNRSFKLMSIFRAFTIHGTQPHNSQCLFISINCIVHFWDYNIQQN